MTIDDAIVWLQTMKNRGVQNILLATWDASYFGLQEGDTWADAADYLDERMDWSSTHDKLHDLLDASEL